VKGVHKPLSTLVGMTFEDKGFALARRRGRVHTHDKTTTAPILATLEFMWRADGLHPRRVRWHVAPQDLQCRRRILELFEALAQGCSWVIGRFGRGWIQHGCVHL
jgi:hypothetical protein